MKRILDEKGNLNISELDNVVASFYSTRNDYSQKVLMEFKNHPNSWMKVPEIFKKSKNNDTKFLAIDILKDSVKFKWKILPDIQKKGMKNFITKYILILCQRQLDSPLLKRLNLTLVEIIKKEWPRNWKSLIPELVNSSRKNPKFCENHMRIFQILSEDIFQFHEGNLTKVKKLELKNSLSSEFQEIFKLFKFIFTYSEKHSLIKSTIKCLHNFMSWIDTRWIFTTGLIEDLLRILSGKRNSFQNNKNQSIPMQVQGEKEENFRMYRNEIIMCFITIVSIEGKSFKGKIKELFLEMMKIVLKKIPPDTDFNVTWKGLSFRDQKFLHSFALFLKSFLSKNLSLVENEVQFVLLAHRYLLGISCVNDEVELFKICLDYWNFLVKDLFYSEKNKQQQLPLMLSSYNSSSRKSIYKNVLERLREIMVSRMAKPEEVIIVEDENGELMKQYLKDVGSIQMYKNMQSTLIYLTHLDHVNMQEILISRLKNQLFNDNAFSWKELNSLCWSIGSISGSMSKGNESKFLVVIIKDLLDLCRKKNGKKNKAVVASNIMYVVLKYPRFLICHWNFLKTVVLKLFEFMHESFQGVQEMACETFYKICMETKGQFIRHQPKETEPFIFPLITKVPEIISQLEARDLHTFFKAIGEIINEAPLDSQQKLIMKLMNLPNIKWSNIMKTVRSNTSILKNLETIENIKNLLKTNTAVASSCKKCYFFQMKIIFKDVIQIYKFYSEEVSKEVKTKGEQITTYVHVRKMRAVKSEILNLIETFVVKSKDKQLVFKSFLSSFLKIILEDYCTNVPKARDPKILSLITETISLYKEVMVKELPEILKKVFTFTLPLISKDFANFPDHRLNLFRLIRVVNKNCFQTFFKIPEEGFTLVMKSILWAIKHKERNNYEEGLFIIEELIQKLKMLNSQATTNHFFGKYYLSILNDVFYVLTDRFHTSGFIIQSKILQQLFFIVANNVVTVPIYDVNKFPTKPSNKIYLRDFFGNLLANSFKNLTKSQIGEFIVKLFKFSSNSKGFEESLKDFLIDMKEFTNVNNYKQFFERSLAIEYKNQKGKNHELLAITTGNNQQMGNARNNNMLAITSGNNPSPPQSNNMYAITSGNPNIQQNNKPSNGGGNNQIVLANTNDRDDMMS